MNPAAVLLRLRGYQSRLSDLIDTTTTLVALEPEVARLPLARARWALARLLREYQLFKHTEIFHPAIRHGDARQTAMAERLRAECIAAGERFTAYVAYWGAEDVAAVWPDHAAAVRDMAARLRTHIDREQRDAATLLAAPTWERWPSRREDDVTIGRAISPARSRPAAREDNHAR